MLCLHGVFVYLFFQFSDGSQSIRYSKPPHRIIIELDSRPSVEVGDQPQHHSKASSSKLLLSKVPLTKTSSSQVVEVTDYPVFQQLNDDQSSLDNGVAESLTVDDRLSANKVMPQRLFTQQSLTLAEAEQDFTYFSDLHEQVHNHRISPNLEPLTEDPSLIENIQPQDNTVKQVIETQVTTNVNSNINTHADINADKASSLNTDNKSMITESDGMIEDSGGDNGDDSSFEAFYREQNRYQSFIYEGDGLESTEFADIPVFNDLIYVSEKRALAHLLKPLQTTLPEQLRQTNKQWKVMVVLYVDEQGRVLQKPKPFIRPSLSSGNDLIDKYSLQLVSQLEFKPFYKQGHPVVAEIELPLTFE